MYLTEQDVLRAAEYLGLTAAEFEKRYVYRRQGLLRLRQQRQAPCFFLQGGGCSIHPAKPTQCRAFPFWPELVDTPRGWLEAAGYCPGIGMGPLFQIETATRISDEMKLAYPEIYDSK